MYSIFPQYIYEKIDLSMLPLEILWEILKYVDPKTLQTLSKLDGWKEICFSHRELAAKIEEREKKDQIFKLAGLRRKINISIRRSKEVSFKEALRTGRGLKRKKHNDSEKKVKKFCPWMIRC